MDASYGIEVIDGGLGNNVIVGTSGEDNLDFSVTLLANIAYIDAGAGRDTVIGTADDDIIVGGLGADNLFGGDGNDIFIVENGDDSVDTYHGDGGIDTVLGGAGDDIIRLSRMDASYGIEVIDGGLGNNSIAGTGGTDTLDFSTIQLVNIAYIDAGSNNDTVIGTGYDDVIIGGTGSDTLYGGDGDDSLTGGAQSDTVNGGLGNDTYLFARGDGQDSIYDSAGDYDSTSDTVLFGADVAADQLWFSSSANDLVVSIIGTSDQIQVKNWYDGAASQTEIFQLDDGSTLSCSQVQQLVSAMAQFSPPASGQLNLTQELHTQLDSVISANWQPAA